MFGGLLLKKRIGRPERRAVERLDLAALAATKLYHNGLYWDM
jgi:hypothetical protein